jgi:type II secretory pathway pseudopilin PulG
VGRRGFTLVEAIIFLAILLILASVAMVVLAGYARSEKISEAHHSLQVIAQNAAAYYDASDDVRPSRHFPPPSRASVPASVESVRRKRYASNANDWALSPWRELKFSIPAPQYFAYSFGSGGLGAQARATATAQGDLDGDGEESMFVLAVTPDKDLHAVVAPEISKTMPEE